ncbi:hypothetical protein K491DRAFT_713149 [Lophiostoma macrostomum CBS 122681]|uniref:Uncharacterized protein n=1 Tax=Lophiostoma macrostomum CBS 122681 TaxID=1314788 RepID=A0A6A6TG74_9PLEO|nr:hypothetical protein K491DRAFT_713149 [Lophiostoma macrostomum CBS 122681]
MAAHAPTSGQLVWTQSHKQSSGGRSFLDLPRELRDLVYLFALRMSGAIFIYSLDPYSTRPVMRAKIVRHKDAGPLEPTPLGQDMATTLMRTCRQVHVESASVLYGKNIFRLYSSNASFAPLYQSLVRHIVFTTDSMIQKIFADNLDTVEYWWRRHFWPDVLGKSSKVLQTFPSLETLTFPMKSKQYGQNWRPAFIASERKTREQRVVLAVNWLRVKCPFPDERLRKCLQLEIVAPTGAAFGVSDLSRDAYDGSRFLPGDEWDLTEFSEAFARAKSN